MEGKSPISKLQETCVRHTWGMPRYYERGCMGPSNERLFFISVDVAGIVAEGSGLTKKAAKTEAAKKALLLINGKDSKTDGETEVEDPAHESGSYTLQESRLQQLEIANAKLQQQISRLQRQFSLLRFSELPASATDTDRGTRNQCESR